MYKRNQSQWREDLRRYLPEEVWEAIKSIGQLYATNAVEVRFGTYKPLQLLTRHNTLFISPVGEIVTDPSNALFLGEKQCALFMKKLTAYSPYAFAEALREGYITLPGGYRVGLCGRASSERERISDMSIFHAFSIRIPCEMLGISDGVLPLVVDGGTVRNTLIISPPGVGKTTFLRDLARNLSHGVNGTRYRVCVVDERGELAGMNELGSGFDIGPCTDVLAGYPKTRAMLMSLRTLNPQVIITDEIGNPEEAQALGELFNAGVAVIASAHGAGVADIARRGMFRDLIRRKYFDLYIVLSLDTRMGRNVRVIRSSDEREAI